MTTSPPFRHTRAPRILAASLAFAPAIVLSGCSAPRDASFLGLPLGLVVGSVLITGVATALIVWIRTPDYRGRYVCRRYLMTRNELAFYHCLTRAVGAQAVVMTQVRLAEVIDVKKGTPDKQRWSAFRRICAMHLDFVVCDPKRLTVLGAIELDDRSHDRRDRKKRDRFLNDAADDAGLCLVRYKARGRYSVRDVREAIEPLRLGQ